jgi:hypothetical protein
MQGGYLSLLRTKVERMASKDPRPALDELYKDYSDYETQYLAAVERLVSQRFLLAEDLARLKPLCEKFRPAFDQPDGR